MDQSFAFKIIISTTNVGTFIIMCIVVKASLVDLHEMLASVIEFSVCLSVCSKQIF